MGPGMSPPSGLREETQNTRGFRAPPQADAWGYFRAPSGLQSQNRNEVVAMNEIVMRIPNGRSLIYNSVEFRDNKFLYFIDLI